MAGAVIGAATHGSSGALYGAGIGALAGGVGELVSGTLVKDVTYTIVTDVMISEKTPEKVAQTLQSELQLGKGSEIKQTSESTVERKRYQTRITSSANKVNLKLEEALSQLIDGLARSISGVF